MSLPWAEFISFWSNWVLVAALVVGVVATYGIVVSGNVKETAAGKEIADAKRDTADAFARIAELDKETVRLGGDAEASRALIAGANERAAEALKKYEEERLARVEIEEQIAPRRLTHEQQTQLSHIFSKYPLRQIGVFSYSLDVESAMLGAQLIESTKGLNVGVNNKLLSIGALGSVSWGILISGSDQNLINDLLGEFSRAGIVATRGDIPISAGMSLGGDEAPAAAKIFIGVKPIQQ